MNAITRRLIDHLKAARLKIEAWGALLIERAIQQRQRKMQFERDMWRGRFRHMSKYDDDIPIDIERMSR